MSFSLTFLGTAVYPADPWTVLAAARESARIPRTKVSTGPGPQGPSSPAGVRPERSMAGPGDTLGLARPRWLGLCPAPQSTPVPLGRSR
jgi:hypothetical protein